MNAQFAIKEDMVYVLEVNPRASRTVPYLSKATGVPLAKVAARLMVGRTLAQLGFTDDLDVGGFFVKSPVFPFVRFPGVDTILGPEMKSTGEVMGAAQTFGHAFAKASIAAGVVLPRGGTAFISVNNHDKPAVVQIARDLTEMGFTIVATRGTANYLRAHGIEADIVFKVNEGRPHVGDEILNNRDSAGAQHAARPGVVFRRPYRPPHRDDARRSVHHDAHRRRRRRQCHQGASTPRD